MICRSIFVVLNLLFIISCERDHFANGASSCQLEETDQSFIVETRSDIALMASRINSLEQLSSVIQIEYYKAGELSAPRMDNDRVVLTYCSNGNKISSVLEKGISQKDILKAKNGEFDKQFELLMQSPFSISHRREMAEIYVLARRRFDLFKWGDVAFFDLAEYSSKYLISDSIPAYLQQRDRGEKGYLNSFNHITAQAFITSIYDEEMADHIADVHELYNMPELVHGVFTDKQLNHPDDNPVDNYVDLINNEIGQELGKKLKEEYGISRETKWTAPLLCKYLNELQSFYSKAFRIRMLPFKEDQIIIARFVIKLNSLDQVGLSTID